MIESWRNWFAAQRLRWAGRPFMSTLILITLFGLIGEFQLFAPYDWFQQTISAQINKKPYTGDVTIVAVDAKTQEGLGHPGLTDVDLARLLSAIDAAKPKQIVIDALPITDRKKTKRDSSGTDGEKESALPNAAQALRARPVMLAYVKPKNTSAIKNLTEGHYKANVPELTAEPLISDLAPYTDSAGFVFWGTPLGAPYSLPLTSHADGTNYPSLSQYLAGKLEPAFDKSYVDLSYDPASIGVISAISIINGTVGVDQLQGRRLLISMTQDALRDTLPSPNDRFTSRASLIVMSAQTVRNGIPTILGWIPAFLIAVGAALFWLFARKPRGRILAGIIFFMILVSPIVLERFSYFQETSVAVVFLLCVGLSHVIRSVRTAIALARNAAETKSWFLAQASHDLRQPIHAIGMLSARLGQTQLSSEQAALVANIDRSVEGVRDMFQSLLDLATIESGSLKPVIVPVACNDLLSQIRDQNMLAAEKAGVDFRVLPSMLSIYTDRSLAMTMLQNIAANAIKYASGKKVLVGCRRQGNTLSFCVYDKGSGISKVELQQVTKAFFRGSRGNGGAEGTGLGLAIVHRLAALLDLRFAMKSEMGHGTGAVISGFRMATATPERLAVSASSGVPKPLDGMQLLLVDDDRDSLQAMESLILQWGCVVETQEAFPRQKISQSVIVTDYDFGATGTLVAHRERIGSLIASGATIIVMSGHHPDTVRKALQQDAVLVLSKPIRPSELRSVLLAAKLRTSAARPIAA